ncbi:hypothetical protein SAMN04487915_103105 [Arthrobacter sp. ov118]|jgi:putative effector of murein hydrolase LrgA (UPF0299 family)|nr:hypothetical protein SAMN04487915_103105 [Arthrobacter sp. ov118]
MGRMATAVSRASWWQVAFLVAMAIVSLLDLTLPRVVGGVVLLALALVVTVCKLLALRARDDLSSPRGER